MNPLRCRHCDGYVQRGQAQCPHCGMPLPPASRIPIHRRFLLFFVALVVFAMIMMLWLPPDWAGR